MAIEIIGGDSRVKEVVREAAEKIIGAVAPDECNSIASRVVIVETQANGTLARGQQMPDGAFLNEHDLLLLALRPKLADVLHSLPYPGRLQWEMGMQQKAVINWEPYQVCGAARYASLPSVAFICVEWLGEKTCRGQLERDKLRYGLIVSGPGNFTPQRLEEVLQRVQSIVDG